MIINVSVNDLSEEGGLLSRVYGVPSDFEVPEEWKLQGECLVPSPKIGEVFEALDHIGGAIRLEDGTDPRPTREE